MPIQCTCGRCPDCLQRQWEESLEPCAVCGRLNPDTGVSPVCPYCRAEELAEVLDADEYQDLREQARLDWADCFDEAPEEDLDS